MGVLQGVEIKERGCKGGKRSRGKTLGKGKEGGDGRKQKAWMKDDRNAIKDGAFQEIKSRKSGVHDIGPCSLLRPIGPIGQDEGHVPTLAFHHDLLKKLPVFCGFSAR